MGTIRRRQTEKFGETLAYAPWSILTGLNRCHLWIWHPFLIIHPWCSAANCKTTKCYDMLNAVLGHQQPCPFPSSVLDSRLSCCISSVAMLCVPWWLSSQTMYINDIVGFPLLTLYTPAEFYNVAAALSQKQNEN